MPKLVDSDARRRHLADAAVRATGQVGPDRVTSAKVAAEAGVPVGVVEHHFPTRDELLLGAAERVNARMVERVRAAGDRGTVGEGLCHALYALLPLDDERRTEAAAWLAFRGRVLTDPVISDICARTVAQVRRRLADALWLAQRLGETTGELDPERDAAALAALVDGLAVSAVNDPVSTPPDLATAAVDTAVARLVDLGDPAPPPQPNPTS